MDIEEYAKQSVLSLKILRWMTRKKIIQNPLSERELNRLEILEKTWGRSELLRAQLSKFPKDRRLRLLTSPDFETKWERYAYSRFCNLEPGRRLPMKKLIDEIELTYGFVLDRWQIKKLYKVRQKVYNKRKESVKSNKIKEQQLVNCANK